MVDLTQFVQYGKSIASAVDNLKNQPVMLVKKTRLIQITQKLHVSEK